MSRPLHVTDEQIAAAQLRVLLDDKLGRETHELVRRIAASSGTDENGPVSTGTESQTETAETAPMPAPPRRPAGAQTYQQFKAAVTTAVTTPKSLPALSAALGVELDAELLKLAMTHRSYADENGGLPSNERLEFLGDSMLGWVVTEHLYRAHPDLPEQQLAKLRASVVNMQVLSQVARELGLAAHLLLGRGEELAGGRDKASVLADAMEAVIGAAYLQHGTETTRMLVLRLFGSLLPLPPRLDWKTALQELTSAADLGVPEYLVQEEGPDHAKTFTATVVVGGQERGSGTGSTRKEAEQQAAETGWRTLSTQIDSDANPGSAAPSSSRQAGHHGHGLV